MHLRRREGGEFSITLQSEGGALSKRVNFPAVTSETARRVRNWGMIATREQTSGCRPTFVLGFFWFSTLVYLFAHGS